MLTCIQKSQLQLYSPSLHSASDTQIFCVQRVCRRTHEERSFQYIGPVIWNSLPFSVTHATSLSSFKSKLKTYLFSSAYWSIIFFLLFPSSPWQVCLCFCSVCVFVWCVWFCLKWMCLSAFVSALGSHEVGHHKSPIIIIINFVFFSSSCDHERVTKWQDCVKLDKDYHHAESSKISSFNLV